jgi:hypothetical protein
MDGGRQDDQGDSGHPLPFNHPRATNTIAYAKLRTP